jgi:hypothetical protein
MTGFGPDRPRPCYLGSTVRHRTRQDQPQPSPRNGVRDACSGSVTASRSRRRRWTYVTAAGSYSTSWAPTTSRPTAPGGTTATNRCTSPARTPTSFPLPRTFPLLETPRPDPRRRRPLRWARFPSGASTTARRVLPWRELWAVRPQHWESGPAQGAAHTPHPDHGHQPGCCQPREPT